MAKGPRVVILLECTTCRQIAVPGVSRYSSTKNKKTHPERLEIKKYCKFEKTHTVHKEIK